MKNGVVICVPDCHVPWHDERAYSLALAVIADVQPNQVVHLGDFADMKAVSSHVKDFGDKPDLDHELEQVKYQWGRLEAAAGRAKLTMTLGNHSTMLTRYAAKNAPMLEGILPSYHALYGMNKRVTVVPYQQIHYIGRVGYVHDLGYAGKTATASTLDAAGHCVVHGHTHRGAVVYNGLAGGERWFGMGCGWLGDGAQIRYVAPSVVRSWQHGIGVVTYREGLAFAQFCPIVEGRCVVDGTLYSAT